MAETPHQAPPRIIPAYAGSTGVEAYPIFDEADHPRIRGEHRRAIWNDAMMMGSSPHTRGALSCRAHRWRIGWIIPAYAGSTVEIPAASFPSEDHPRIRGEHGSNSATTIWSTGSSPHTRGAREWEWQGSPSRWIIPAYAGSTPTNPTGSAPLRDHPRIRGEHDCSIYFTNFPTGSSPHTRGAHDGAGVVRIVGLDHPRIRGEHRRHRRRPDGDDGSSPHTRGAPPEALRIDPRNRIIPAYAGSTYEDSLRCQAIADHPRIRGEHLDIRSQIPH